MTGEDMLFEMIITANQAVLDELNVVILRDDLVFAHPDGGDWPDGNTRVGVTAVKGMTTGTNTYYYDRLDIQEAFVNLGYDEVTVNVGNAASMVTVLDALKVKHNLDLAYGDVRNYHQDGNVITFDIKERHLVFTGTLTVTVEEGSPLLATQFPNNILDGLYAPSEESAPA